MAQIKVNQKALTNATWLVILGLLMVTNLGTAERLLKYKNPPNYVEEHTRQGLLDRVSNFLWQPGKSSYEPVWPVRYIFSLAFMFQSFSLCWVSSKRKIFSFFLSFINNFFVWVT